MSDQDVVGISKMQLRGDAVSQFVQIICRRAKCHDLFKWTGNGEKDVEQVVLWAKNAMMARDEIYQAVCAMWNHPRIRQARLEDEVFEAEIAAHILRSRANIELNLLQPLKKNNTEVLL